MKERVRLRVLSTATTRSVDSITPVWPSANFYEREVLDLFGVRFAGHPNLRRIMMPDEWEGHPAAQGLSGGGLPLMTEIRLPTGSAASNPTSSEGSTIPPWSSTWGRSIRRPTACCAWCSRSTARRSLKVVPDIGYLHTGIEKTCEAKFYQQVVPMTDRIDYLSPMSNNLCYCLAVEKLLRAGDSRHRRSGCASCSTSSRDLIRIWSGSAPTPWTSAR